MKVTGRTTRTVFDRHHLVSPGDRGDAACKLAGKFSGASALGAGK
jgi:hypothetical protein